VARVFITIGGIGTILAISAVFLFLLSVVLPLLLPGTADPHEPVAARWQEKGPLQIGVDEYRVMGWAFFRDGSLSLFRLDTGEQLATRQVVDGDSLTAWSFSLTGGDVAFGFAGGEFQTGTLGFVTDFPPAGELPENAATLAPGDIMAVRDAIVEKTPEGQFRRQRLAIDLETPVHTGTGRIALIDFVRQSSALIVSYATTDNRVFINRVRQHENLMTGDVVSEIDGGQLPAPASTASNLPPLSLRMSESGTNVFLVWESGRVVRYDARDLSAPAIAEETRLVEGSTSITDFELLLGRSTLLAGDSDGRVSAWFTHRDATTINPDGLTLAEAHDFADGNAPITRIAPSPRDRVIAVGDNAGAIRVYQVTSEARVVDVKTGGAPIDLLIIAPKSDGIIALAGDKLWQWDFDERYPEATLAALFTPVWYEGYEKPEHVWQSSSGTDDFEAKLGMWPLVFGTLKATLYSMLFGIPLALLAAIYTSEFLAPALRNKIKTLIELMASLPSVVLGFLAALVFAPFVQKLIPTVIVGFVTLPGMVLLGAYLWQLAPYRWTLRVERYQVLLVLAWLPVGVLSAVWLGPIVERVFFLGDVLSWLDGNEGSGIGGWMILFLPLAALFTAIVINRTLSPALRGAASRMDRPRIAALDLARFVAGALFTLLTAFVFAWLLNGVGIDPRGPNFFLDTYVQRNALVVGFVMGFAIIPIIYTIAEDALSAVPEHLRAASLGAGATRWQTAIRIVIPTAMSGLFSAIMIGLGRAVGETMIVLMAAGNTPVLEMNIFNGFRTLSANIAVELPEAVKDSTHYRTLFLAALILFMMTFLINTVAELVRLRFRKRAHQL